MSGVHPQRSGIDAVSFARLVASDLDERLAGVGDAAHLAVIGLLAGGHVLVEGDPGIGKTTLAQRLAALSGGGFARIQFTPDLLPSDIVGFDVPVRWSDDEVRFRFNPGPIFGREAPGEQASLVVLADEINRASPRTQAALLQAMAEGEVTVGHQTYPLAEHFLVLATQNDVEHLGTFDLPAAQLDRFLLKIEMRPPPLSEWQGIVARGLAPPPVPRATGPGPSLGTGDLTRLKAQAASVTLNPWMQRAIGRLVWSTNPQCSDNTLSDVRDVIALGGSPRAALALARAIRVSALLDGRDVATVDDLKRMSRPLLIHRLIPVGGARPSDVAQVLDELVAQACRSWDSAGS